MAMLVHMEKHSTFASASERAKILARRYGEDSLVQRLYVGWVVLVFAQAKKHEGTTYVTDRGTEITLIAGRIRVVSNDSERIDPYCAGGTDDLDDYDETESLDSLREEIDGDREDWARSDDEGWYYADD